MFKRIIKQYRAYNPAAATKNLFYNFFNRERKKSFGRANPDKIFYVIRGINSDSPFYIGVEFHLMANYFYVLSHLKYASDRGWVPVVDQLNYPVYTSKCGPVDGVENAWEYFWHQPTPYTLKDAYESRHVVLSKRLWVAPWNMGYDVENHKNRQVISFYHGLTKSIPLKKNIADHVNTVRSGLFEPGERVLGVAVRFAGHSQNCYFHGPGHPIAPAVGVLIELAAAKLKQWNMDRIFLASDEQRSVKDFKSVFGERLAVIERKRTDPTKIYNHINIKPMYSVESIYDTTLNYLTEMEILVGCAGLIGSISSGLRYAIVNNNNAYEHAEILDCGRFPDTNTRSCWDRGRNA